VTLLDWVFQHWSPRNVTSRHNDCLTKRAVGECAVGKQARKYALIFYFWEAGTLEEWSGFKLFFFRHVGDMAWRGWSSVFQASVKNMAPRSWVKSPNSFCDILATTI
jgi:hypothetical protein